MLVLAVPASSTMDNVRPKSSDVLLETLVVKGGDPTPVRSTLDFSPDVAYTMVVSGTVRSYNESHIDAPPATHDAFYCVTGCEDPCSFEPCNRRPGRSGALRMKAEFNFGGSDNRASDFEPIDEFVRGTFDQPVYRDDHRYGVRLGDRLFYRPAGHISFVDGVPPRADRPRSGEWKIEIWGKRTRPASACSVGEPREKLNQHPVTANWSVRGRRVNSRGRVELIGTPAANKPVGSKRDFYGEDTGTTCWTDGGRHFELVHLPDTRAEIHDSPAGYRATFFARVAESDDPVRCPKGSHAIVELIDSRRPGTPDTVSVGIDRPCSGHGDRRYRAGVSVSIAVKKRSTR
jgi:hypothetical protein